MPVNAYQYSPTPAGEQGGKAVTQDWDKELGGGVGQGVLPAGYNNYVQGWDPTQSKWMYNPNSGAKYGTLADGSWGELPGQNTPTNVLTQGAAPTGAPKPGDPNYYKYMSTGGQPYTMPSQQGAPAVPGNLANDTQNMQMPAPGAGPTRGTPTFTNPTGQPAPQQRSLPGAAPGAMQPSTQPAPTGPGVIDENMMGMQVVRNPNGSFAQPPATGVGAGRSYPSNWNQNNSPGLDNGNTPFAIDPNTGASYEVSPMYQWQKQQGEKALRRQLQARGRLNSSVGFNTLANFENQLGANEANQQYQREFQQQQLGMQAALAQAASQGASSAQLAQMYMQMGGQLGQGANAYSGNLQNIINQYMQQQGGNVLNTGATIGNAAINLATGQAPYTTQQGQSQGQIYAGLGQLPGQFMNAYQQNRAYQPNYMSSGPGAVSDPSLYDPNFGVTGYQPMWQE